MIDDLMSKQALQVNKVAIFLSAPNNSGTGTAMQRVLRDLRCIFPNW